MSFIFNGTTYYVEEEIIDNKGQVTGLRLKGDKMANIGEDNTITGVYSTRGGESSKKHKKSKRRSFSKSKNSRKRRVRKTIKM